jgi:hypothetical protein
MSTVWGLFLLSGFYPVYRAWRGTTGNTLRYAVLWAALAWGVWCLAAWFAELASLRYLALCLTASAGVAVLGARRPGAGAWNFVVAGLVAALCRPFLEGSGQLRLEGGHLFFLGVALAVALGNYVPTRQAPAVLVLGGVCAVELLEIQVPGLFLLLGLVPWLALLSAGRQGQGEDFDTIWRNYRDRFGFVWAQRLREQFNNSSRHAGWGVVLGWSGIQETEAGRRPEPERLVATLRALLTRFRTEGS